MSGSVAEALLASGSKKLPLLPAPPKSKQDQKTFSFNLELAESNEQSYPEFSWTELVRNSKQKEISKRAESGRPVLDPYASDDEDDLKAMAARFEAKYNTVAPPKKKKRRLEDFIDKGAGYDETDPFIDNSDIYDEVVPPDLQTVHGGFYINSGSLDFKEVELSEDEDDSVSQVPKISKPKLKLKVNSPKSELKKNLVGRPVGSGMKIKRPVLKDKNLVHKKRKIVITPIGPDGKLRKISSIKRPESAPKLESKSSDVVNITSSSSSSSSSTTEASSSSSDSESSSSEETEAKTEKLKLVKAIITKSKSGILPGVTPKHGHSLNKSDSSMPSVIVQTPQPKRLKSVPLNPKLHPNLAISAAPTTTPPTFTPSHLNSNSFQPKVLNKDLMKTNGGSANVSPRNMSPSGNLPPISSSSLNMRNNPKPITSISPGMGLTISPVTPQPQKSSNNLPLKPKIKSKPANTVAPISTMDIFNSITSYAGLPTLPNLNFAPPITSPNSSLLKTGLNLINSQKAMPNLKKISQPQPTEKLVPSKPKPVKLKPKTSINNISSAIHSPYSIVNSYTLANMPTYKTPPPLAGPGVEASKRVSNSSKTNSSLAHAVSLANSQLLVNQGISSMTSMLNPSSNMVNSVSSSLTVSRLPQSITITPTPHSLYSPVDRASLTSTGRSSVVSPQVVEPKPKHISPYDMSSLLQQTSATYTNALAAMAKSSAGKTPTSIVNSKDLQRK